MRKVLVIGGTGIIGRVLISRLVRAGDYQVDSVALDHRDDPIFSKAVHQHVVDRYSPEYVGIINDLQSEWDAVVDICAFDKKAGEQTYTFFKDRARHIITLSTTLIYDRSQESQQPISEDALLASEGDSGGYADGKVRLEKFWQSKNDANWAILRPYHILGQGSLLGCVPAHNRDPKLLERINSGETLRLVNGGNISLNQINAGDIATAICEMIGNEKTFRQAYNVVNPKVITAREYYEEIGRQLGRKIIIDSFPISDVWEEKRGWEMTTLPHIYSVEKLKTDTGFTPSVPLSEGIRDAIAFYPEHSGVKIPVHQHMNKPPHPKKPDWLK